MTLLAFIGGLALGVVAGINVAFWLKAFDELGRRRIVVNPVGDSPPPTRLPGWQDHSRCNGFCNGRNPCRHGAYDKGWHDGRIG